MYLVLGVAGGSVLCYLVLGVAGGVYCVPGPGYSRRLCTVYLVLGVAGGGVLCTWSWV